MKNIYHVRFFKYIIYYIIYLVYHVFIIAGPELYGILLTKQMTVQGFVVYRWFDKFETAWADILKWISEVMCDTSSYHVS